MNTFFCPLDITFGLMYHKKIGGTFVSCLTNSMKNAKVGKLLFFLIIYKYINRYEERFGILIIKKKYINISYQSGLNIL